MSATAKVTWNSKVKERTEQEIAKSLETTLSSDNNNVADDDAQSTFTVTITVRKATRSSQHNG